MLLAVVQQRERGLRLDGGVGIALHRFVEAPRFVLFVVEVFDGFVVQQAVDRFGIRVLIGLVHFAAVLDAPAGDREGEPDIGRNHRDGDDGYRDIELQDHLDAEQQKLQQRGENAEDGEGEQRVDTLGAALDHARKAAGLALEMEAQRKRVDMGKGRDADFAHRVILHAGKNTVAKLGEDLHQDARQRVTADHGERHRERNFRRRVRQRIGGGGEEER